MRRSSVVMGCAVRRFWLRGVLLLALAPVDTLAARTSTLPLTRVRLYETGVGYFERAGVVPAGETALPVPAGHLDDALKTLVVLSGAVKVNGVAFSSSVSRGAWPGRAGALPRGHERRRGQARTSVPAARARQSIGAHQQR